MKQYPRPLAKLIGELSKLPGIGYKTAQRLAFHILSLEDSEAEALAQSITDAKREMKYCSICGKWNYSAVSRTFKRGERNLFGIHY